MSRPNSSRNVKLNIGGDVSGQIVIGDNNLLIGDVHGGVVNIVAPQKKPVFSQQARPVHLRPHAIRGMLDRAKELGTVVGALEVPESVSIYGHNGLGKTTLLRYLAYNSPEDRFPAGVVFLSARGANVDDLLQNIFENFYESDQPAKPTHTQLCQLLQNVRALILLDDVTLTRDQIAELINTLPQCAFIFGSIERCLWGEGRCIALDGLPVQDALLLIERELGRRLDAEERPLAESFCQKIKGHPLSMIQAAALVQQGKTFAEIEDRFRETEDTRAKVTLTQLTDSQKQVLSLLAALGNFPVPAHHLAALSQAKDFDTQLKTLQDLHLIQANSPAYNLTSSLALSLERVTNLAGVEDRTLEYFVQWIKQNPPLPEVTEVLNLLLNLLEKANRDGRWDDVIALGRGIEKALILAKRWQSWLQVLEWILKAAQALGDRATQGWALHQLGTRALCLGNLEPARQSLTQALSIREALGDKAGAAVTRHNLSLILAPPAPPRETPPKAGGSPVLKIVGGFLVIAVVVIVAVLIWGGGTPPPPPPPPPPPTTRAPVVITVTKRIVPVPTEPPTEPPAQTCRPGVWYCENFDDNNAQDFALEPGWAVRSNALEGIRPGWATLTNHEWSDYRLTFRLRLTGGTIHLSYRHTPENGPRRYFAGFNENTLFLRKQMKNDPVELMNIDAFHPLNEWHTVEIAGWGGHLAVYVDGTLELQYMDEKFLQGGTFAFEILERSQAQIDDIEVRESGKEPRRPDPNSPRSCASLGQVAAVTTERDTDRMGMDYWDGPVFDYDLDELEVCQKRCTEDTRCQAYTFRIADSHCWLKEGAPAPAGMDGVVSGVRTCADPNVRAACKMTTEKGFDKPGMDIRMIPMEPLGIAPLWERCANECLALPACQAYAMNTNTNECWLKSAQPNSVPSIDIVSGIKACP